MTKTSTEYPPSAERPLVTFALFAYNQEKYIREAVEGALSQTYEPLEIILSDDCSTDRTFEIMQEILHTYGGPHRVKLRHNQENFGLAAHVNQVFAESQGEIVVMAAGDDISSADRCTLSVSLLDKFPEAAEVLLSADIIDAEGRTIGERLSANGQPTVQKLKDLFSWRSLTFGAGRAIRRRVFFKFGPLMPKCPTEDTPLLLRSLLCGGSLLSDEKAVQYRIHEANLSGAPSLLRMDVSAIHAQYREDMARAAALEIFRPQDKKIFQRWIKEDAITRRIRLKLAIGDKIGLKDALHTIRLPSFGRKSKLKAVVSLFLLSRKKAK